MMLRLEDLEVRYGSVPAVRGLSLEVAEGEIVGLIGANGAGKSTTLHAIMGLVPVRSGKVLLRDVSIVGRPPEVVARSGIALVPEGRRIYPNLTVEENLRLGLAGRRARPPLRRRQRRHLRFWEPPSNLRLRDGVAKDVAWVRELFPVVAEFARRQAGALSGGQQQQLAIARALVASPDLLLLDEPSLGLAPQLVDTVFAALSAIRERGVTVLLVEQRAQRTVAFADRTYVLANGELTTTLGPKDADHTARLIAAYMGASGTGPPGQSPGLSPSPFHR